MSERLLLPGNPAYIATVNEVAEQAYEEVAWPWGENTHRAGRCEPITDSMQRGLQGRGIPVLRHYVNGPGPWRYHYFLRDLAGPNTIVDPTWLFFVEEPPSDLPKVLIGQVRDIQRVCDDLPVDPYYSQLWSYPEPWADEIVWQNPATQLY